MRTNHTAPSSYAAAIAGSNALQPHPRPQLTLVEGGRAQAAAVAGRRPHPRARSKAASAQQLELIGPETARTLGVLVALSMGLLFLF